MEVEIPRLCLSGGRWDAEEWAQEATKWAAHDFGHTIALHNLELSQLVMALTQAQANQRSLILMPSHWPPEEVVALARGHMCSHLVSGREVLTLGPAGNSVRPDATVGLFTSGTTGKPKLVRHRWGSLVAPSKLVPPRLHGAKWYLAYAPQSFAGLQVIFSALNNGGELHHSEGSFAQIAKHWVEHQVDVVSATPTFWRMILSAWPQGLSKPLLRQASVGGEAVDQSILDLIQSTFSPEKLTHIYASTETGPALVASDGLAGYPLSLLERKGDVLVRIQDGQLEVASKLSMTDHWDGLNEPNWYRTPDLVEIKANRLHVVGRVDGILNVGGAKISPERIETSLCELSQVVDARVHSIPNPITGALLAVDIQLKPNQSLSKVEATQHLRAQLPESHVPRMIRFVEHIPMNASRKKSRLQ